MRYEKGVSLSGFLVVVVILIFGLLFGFKVGPAYFEYYQITKNLRAVANDPAIPADQVQEVRKAFDRRAQIDDMKSVTGADLEISKADGGGLLLEAAWSVKVPLFGNLSACMDFEASSAE